MSKIIRHVLEESLFPKFGVLWPFEKTASYHRFYPTHSVLSEILLKLSQYARERIVSLWSSSVPITKIANILGDSNEVFLRVTNHTGQAEKNLLGQAGIRTATFGLLVRCSTNWATGQVGSWSSNDGTRAIWYFETESSFFHI